MARFTELPADIVDHILTQLPDFRCLAAAIKISKVHTYTVFRNHRKTILTSVAVNLAGPTLPHALQVAISQEHPEAPVDLNYDDSIDGATSLLIYLNSSRRQLLEKNTTVVQTLEDLYSQMCARSGYKYIDSDMA